MLRSLPGLLLCAPLALALAGCGESDLLPDSETSGTAAATTGTSDATGATTDRGTGAGSAATGSGGATTGTGSGGTTAAAGCTNGIDMNGDGICDRENADWSENARLPEGGDRRDIYQLGEHLQEVVTRGLEHMLVWPVDVSGALLPWGPMQRLLDPEATRSGVLAQQNLMRQQLGFGTLPEMYEWVGLAQHDGSPEAWPGQPWPAWVEEGMYLGVGVIDTPYGEALTYSCATCHTADLFGRTVVGLSNRRAQANEYFHAAAEFYPSIRPSIFRSLTGANEDEVELFTQTQRNLARVGLKIPEARGLDTSLAQVGLSLARRGLDPFASRDVNAEREPRHNELETHIADSKPAVWWNLRYKTAWLSDASIVTGNPIFTNFLWNELGRGTDLELLEAWLQNNLQAVDELTVAVFATEAPRYVDFFGEERVDVEAARRGEALFNATCSQCHGVYLKAWNGDNAHELVGDDLLATTFVQYNPQTTVEDVGTSPLRAEGMAFFAERLNELAISQWMETVVEVQEGYVPPPLVGIWARYPYLHNHSVPTLCEMLLPAHMRSEVFWMGPDQDPETDFDHDCVGLPVGEAIPESWRENPRDEIDTRRTGLSNQGHDEWLQDEQGEPIFSAEERRDLVEFLKTL